MTDIAKLGYSVDSSQLKTATTELDRNASAAQRTGKAADDLGRKSDKLALSQKQLAMAQRQLPMQFTDIAVSLQAGQSPMQVFLQQGAQIKDTFGGVGPALRASAGYITGLINPITGTIAVLGTLFLAWKQQEDQLNEFTISLARTNNFIGLTVEELDSLSDSIADSTSATRGEVQETVNRIVGGGRLTQEQFRLVAASTAEWAAVSGDSIDTIAKKYEDLAKDPVEALLKLNESERFLTQAQLDRVKAMVEEGRQQDAVTEAVRIYADQMDRATSQVKSNLSEMSKSWMDVKNVISDVWNAIGNFADGIVGITRRQAEANVKLIASYAAAARQGSPAASMGATIGFIRGIPDILSGGDEPAAPRRRPIFGDEQPVDSSAVREEQKLQEQWDRMTLSNLSKQEKLQREIDDIKKNGVRLGKTQAEIDGAIADAQARYKESLPKGRKGSTTDPTIAIIQRLQQQIALNEEQVKSEEKLTATERMLVQVRTELDRIGGKGSATNKRIIEDLIQQARATDEAAQAAERKLKADEAVARQAAIFEQQRTNQGRANEIELLSMGRGSDAVDMLRRQLSIEREYQDELKRLGDRSVARDKETWDQLAENARVFRDQQLQEERQFQQQRAEAMANGMLGYNKAYEDYIERAKDVAGQAEAIFSEAFQTIEDIGVDGLSGNLEKWESYFENLHQMILRFIVRQQLSKWMESLNQAGAAGSSGGGGNWFTSLLGAVFSSGGPRAAGGDVWPNKYHRVGEGNQPELLNMGRNQYLIPGDRGNVEPMRGASRSGSMINLAPTIVVQGRVDKATRTQIGSDMAEELRFAQRNF